MSTTDSSSSATPTAAPTNGSADGLIPPFPRQRNVVAVRSTTTAAAATVGNLTILALGAIGQPIQVITGWAPDGADLTVTEVVATTIVAVVVGTITLGLAARSFLGRPRWWVSLSAAVAVLSTVPLWRLEVDSGSKLGLTAMHLLTGVVFVVGHAGLVGRIGQRSAPATGPAIAR